LKLNEHGAIEIIVKSCKHLKPLKGIETFSDCEANYRATIGGKIKNPRKGLKHRRRAEDIRWQDYVANI
jgi:hypothetical protein